MGKAALITGLICLILGFVIVAASWIPMFYQYSIITVFVGAMFVVAGVVLAIYGALKR